MVPIFRPRVGRTYANRKRSILGVNGSETIAVPTFGGKRTRQLTVNATTVRTYLVRTTGSGWLSDPPVNRRYLLDAIAIFYGAMASRQSMLRFFRPSVRSPT